MTALASGAARSSYYSVCCFLTPSAELLAHRGPALSLVVSLHLHLRLFVLLRSPRLLSCVGGGSRAQKKQKHDENLKYTRARFTPVKTNKMRFYM